MNKVKCVSVSIGAAILILTVLPAAILIATWTTIIAAIFLWLEPVSFFKEATQEIREIFGIESMKLLKQRLKETWINKYE